jgi:hypothetical protein
MQKRYAHIAYSIGRGINQRREIVAADPLPDRLLDLLHTLREKDHLEELSASNTRKPRPKAA